MIEELWYKNAIIYSLDLETFMDANGDGVGDFTGLNRRLDYLQALGVDAVWLAPFQPTPNQDNGYDIKDYYGVDPRHGSSGDFVEFMHQANKRGIKVLIDLVVNHTSIKHPWFQDARSSEDSLYRDWYIWSKKKPANSDKGMAFPGVEKTTWTYDKQAQAYYFHRFYSFQPDLNMDNENVRAEIRRIMGYWLQLGVAGFRVDALPFVLESTEPGTVFPPMNFDYLREMRRFLQWRKGDAIILGEANVLPEESYPFFGEDGEGVHLLFNFFVNQHLFHSLATADTTSLIKALEATRTIPITAQWANFLRNHDELDLGNLTEEQRQAVFARFGPDPSMQIYGRGLRRRLASMIGSRQQTELAYSLMFSLPGAPVIRYGDEIGMGDDLTLKEREAVRTPMQWCSDPQAGFSAAEKLVHPIIDEGPYAFSHVNVEAQRRDSSSLLKWMTMLIRLRKECPEIGWGQWQILSTERTEVLAMHYSWKGNSVVILHNFDHHPQEAILNLKQPKASRLIDLMNNEQSEADSQGVHKIMLEAYGYRWFRAGDLSHLLNKK
ncbi:alpha-amylase family protein [Tellurirhabdus bombi]|uniref:alpha-amylase family protein n=1 Tax=Tellurirhabdus bombi TaxID=2907205 RepID=UPI001F1E0259|nr:alpha-amylase family protein [Tellurirhabdus bombi]